MADFDEHGDMDTHRGNAKDLFKLISHSPALLIATVVGIGLVVLLLMKKGASSTSTTTSSDSSPVVVGVRPQYIINAPPVQVSQATAPSGVSGTNSAGAPTAPASSTPAPAVAPPASTTSVTAPHTDYAVVRSKGTISAVASYDASHTGVPIRSQPGSGNDQIGTISFGTQVQITGPAINGTSNFTPGQSDNGSGTNLWYPVITSSGQKGYVSAYDITNSYQTGGGYVASTNTSVSVNTNKA